MRRSRYDWSLIIMFTSMAAAALFLISQAESQMTVTAGSPSVISSVIVPPSTERSVMFSDRGRTYLVGVLSGRVVIVDGSAPAPLPPSPVTPSLTGLAKTTYDSVMALPVDAQTKARGAAAMISAIDSTLSEMGGLNITDPQTLINTLASNAEAAQINTLLKGWKLGDILSGANVTTKDQLVKAMEEIKAGLKEVR